ncbi:hypothetical protein ACVILH_003165 [Bradyrhizobium sp. USDA 4353]
MRVLADYSDFKAAISLATQLFHKAPSMILRLRSCKVKKNINLQWNRDAAN